MALVIRPDPNFQMRGTPPLNGLPPMKIWGKVPDRPTPLSDRLAMWFLIILVAACAVVFVLFIFPVD